MAEPIRVLIADDSELFADVMAEIFAPDERLRIVAAAPNGRIAVELCDRLRPAVVIMDVLMPVMSGLDAIEEIMARCPTPILVLSSDPTLLGFEALRRGALEVRPKPSGLRGSGAEQEELRRIVHTLSSVPVLPRRRRREGRAPGVAPRRRAVQVPAVAPTSRGDTSTTTIARRPAKAPARANDVAKHATDVPARAKHAATHANDASPRGTAGAMAPAAIAVGDLPTPRDTIAVVGIVASTGGPAALATLLASLPPGFPAAIVVVQHLSPGFVDKLALWLARVSHLRVLPATEGLSAVPGTVILAADHQHLTLDAKARCRLSAAAPVRGHRPSGDLLLESLAHSFGVRALGVVLTGMGDDGARGLLALRQAGAITLTEAESSAVVYGMPRAALESGGAEKALPLQSLGAALGALASARANEEEAL